MWAGHDARWGAVRDHDRRRTYAAESRAFDGTLVDAPLTLAEATELCHALTTTRWWQRHGTHVTLMRATGTTVSSRFCRSTGTVLLAEAQQNPLTLAHELAHAASDDAHGPHFRAALCALIHALCGMRPSAILREEFTRGGLSVGVVDLEGLPDPPLLARHPRFGT